ncbi:SDR family NAD(P)-dependent oxidoreductase, partial [Variovorax sp. J22R24]
MKSFDLTGRTALITGSSAGIGFALARGLAGAGARVILNAR